MPVVLSPSNMKLFVQCPRKFQAQYITKEIRFKQSESAKRGEELHALLESAIRHGWESITWPDPATEERARIRVKSVLALRDEGWELLPEMSLAISRQGEHLDWFDKAPKNFMRCRIDVLCLNPKKDFALILDWKTGKNWSEKDAIQLAVNALCVQAVYGVGKYVSGFIYLDNDDLVFNTDDPLTVPVRSFNELVASYPESIPAPLLEVMRVADAITWAEQKNEFPATPNKFCHWCELTCPHRN